MARTFKGNTAQDLARYLFGEMSPDRQTQFLGGIPTTSEDPDFTYPDINAALEGQGGVTLGQLGNLTLGAARQHPIKAMGLVGLGAGNVGGLVDNDKFGGQLGGLALGGLGSYLSHANPYAAAMMTMGGGELGALFDKLRAKREGQRNQMAQQQQLARR